MKATHRTGRSSARTGELASVAAPCGPLDNLPVLAQKAPGREGDMLNREIPKFDARADGLRGIASMNVVLTHYFACFVPVLLAGNYPRLYHGDGDALWIYDVLRFPLFNIFYNGQFAVLVFFVLSGYVLTLPAYTGNRDTINRRFWGRYLRLNIPVAVSVFLAWLMFTNGLFLVDGRVALPNPGWTEYHFPASIPVWQMLLEAVFTAVFEGDPSLNAPLWSIGTEFVGSMLLLAFFFAPGRRKWIAVASVFVIGTAVYTTSAVYLIAIFAGAHIVRLRPGRAGVLVCGILGIYLGGYQQGSVYYDFLHVQSWLPSAKNMMNMAGAVCLTTAIINGFASRLLLHPWAQFLGRVSFPLYILHFIVLVSFGFFAYDLLAHWAFVTGAHLVAYVAVCLGVSLMFEIWIDRPAIRLSKRFARAVMGRLDRMPAGADPMRDQRS